MKKTLLLSVVATSFMMAGGDIAPAEPVVVTQAPVVASAVESGWKFSGQGVVYYQTDDAGISSRGLGTGQDFNLFNQGASAANAGIQLRATNDNVIAGIGFGAELTGLGTLGLEEDIVSDVMQTATTATVSGPLNTPSNLNGAYFSQLYLTYGIGNTSLKVGRQELPKSLSPFAFSEDWNVFKNTFDAALVINTDIPNTVLVGAWVRDLNQNYLHSNMNSFMKPNFDRGIWMLTAQNKSIENLTLTGTWYYGNNYVSSGKDLNILWGDAQYNAGIANLGLQGGTLMLNTTGFKNTNAFGAQVSGKLFDMVNASAAYSHVNSSSNGVYQIGGETTALYTDTVLNQVDGYVTWSNFNNDSNKFVVRADVDVLGGNLAGVYAYNSLGSSMGSNDINEFDLVYSTKVTDDITAAISYVYADTDNLYLDVNHDTNANLIRVVAKYNF